MRTREEIISDTVGHTRGFVDAYTFRAILEVLLDIREILLKDREKHRKWVVDTKGEDVPFTVEYS